MKLFQILSLKGQILAVFLVLKTISLHKELSPTCSFNPTGTAQVMREAEYGH